MNTAELRYSIYKKLVEEVYGATLVSPVPGEPIQIKAITKDPSGDFRHFTISIQED